MTTTELDRLDITRNVARPPSGSTPAFVAGWRAREAGITTNPYTRSPSTQPPEWHDWNAGDYARGEVGFDYSHRIGSGTRLGPFRY